MNDNNNNNNTKIYVIYYRRRELGQLAPRDSVRRVMGVVIRDGIGVIVFMSCDSGSPQS